MAPNPPAVIRDTIAAWLAVMTRPRAALRDEITAGKQAPALVFAMGVVAIEELVRLGFVGPSNRVLGGGPWIEAVAWIGIAVLLVTPAVLHLVAGLQTLLLVAVARDRAGISETVQVIAYATAPCVAAGIPSPALRVACGAYGTWLLIVGIGIRHELGPRRAGLVAAIPAAIVFGYGFRAFPAIGTLLARWYII